MCDGDVSFIRWNEHWWCQNLRVQRTAGGGELRVEGRREEREEEKRNFADVTYINVDVCKVCTTRFCHVNF